MNSKHWLTEAAELLRQCAGDPENEVLVPGGGVAPGPDLARLMGLTATLAHLAPVAWVALTVPSGNLMSHIPDPSFDDDDYICTLCLEVFNFVPDSGGCTSCGESFRFIRERGEILKELADLLAPPQEEK